MPNIASPGISRFYNCEVERNRKKPNLLSAEEKKVKENIRLNKSLNVYGQHLKNSSKGTIGLDPKTSQDKFDKIFKNERISRSGYKSELFKVS